MDEMFEMDDTQYITINIDKCISNRDTPAVVRQLFIELRNRGYINIGEYFRTMPQEDLDVLRACSDLLESDATPEQESRAYESLLLFGLGLMVGEGQELTDDTAKNGVKLVVTYVALEHLFRLDMIEVFRENWSTYIDEPGQIARAKQS